METPARFTFSPDGNTKVFPIPVTMKGDNYVRIDIDGVTINDRTKFDLVNNAVVLVDVTDVPAGSQLDVLVVQTDEGISNLGTVNSIDIVASNITDVQTVATNIASVNTTATNITAVNNVATNMASVTDAVNQAAAAATSAAAALVSKNAAEASELAAAASKNAAATSATNAATSASNASTSASAASASQTAAATSATNAANSATSSAASAASSSTSATNAAGSATAAATSATNAATSATNSANSASAAAASQTAAATSATNAATSETNAAGSATAAAASQVAAAASAASAANSYDLFDDRYLGSKTSDPTLDNDGNALVQGALYFNSTANEMRVYDGANWIAASSAGGASLLNYNYTATAGQTTFSGADDNAATLSYTQQNLIVTLNGIVLEDGTDYTASNGTSIVLTTAAAAGDELNIVAFKSFTTADMVPASTGGTFSGHVNVPAGASGSQVPQAQEVVKKSGDTMTGDLIVDANVGIWTHSPTSLLSVGSTSTSSGDIALRTTKTAATITPSNSDAGGLDINVGWVSGGQGPLTFSISDSVKMRIDSAGRVTMPYQPAFSAYNLASTSQYSTASNTWATFDSQLNNWDSQHWFPEINTGSVFSPSNGRFTAPIYGKYLIKLNVSFWLTNTIYTTLFRNGVYAAPYSLAYSGTVGTYQSLSLSCILQLSAGDYIEAGAYMQPDTYIPGGGYINFSGYLIG